MLKTNAKYEFSDGFFKMKQSGAPGKWVYIDTQEDSVIVYDVQHRGSKRVVDVSESSKQVLTFEYAGKSSRDVMFRQGSFDLDFLTIPIKYRPSVAGFPHQLNTHLNGGVYLGFRKDIYHLGYDQTPLDKQQRHTTYLGFPSGALPDWVLRQ